MRRAVSSRLMTSFGGVTIAPVCGFVGTAPVALTRRYGIAAATPIRLALPTDTVNLKKVAGGEKASFTDPDMIHFRRTATPHPLYDKPDVIMPRKPQDPAVAHPGDAVKTAHAEVVAEWENPQVNAVWSKEELLAVSKTHKKPKDIVDRIALTAIKIVRGGFDIFSGYAFGRLTPNKILRRVLFLETVAGIPGMVAGTLRHLESLRRMKRDYGWIHTLLEEAENERMHMLVFMKLYQPNVAFRGCVLIAQGIFWNAFFLSYLASPRLCHRFVGYLEEEAVRTYTHVLEVMKSDDPRDADVVAFGKLPAHEIAIRYWKLPADSTMYDVVLAVRADEANHRDVNHVFATLKKSDRNPFLDHKQGPAAKHAAEILKE
jgi:hypothetical protein